MRSDSQRVVLKRNGKVIVDGADMGWRWNKTYGFAPEFKLYDGDGINRVRHYVRRVFVLKVLDFHNGCGEFS